MTRVLIVLSSANRRGAEVQGNDLGHALVGAGLDAKVIALTPASAGSTSIDVPVLGVSPLSPGTLARLRSAAADRDVVIGYGSKTLPACAIALFGSPAHFVYRSIGDPRAWAGGRVHRFRTSMLYRRPDRVAALWDDAERAVHELYRVPSTKTTSIPNARFADSFRPVEVDARGSARRDLGLPTDARVAGWLGSMGPEKRVAVAIEAVTSQPDLHLVVAGSGADWTAAQAAARRAPSRIHLIGAVSDPRPFYAAIDAVVSTSRTEGMPGVVIEAALSARPAVVTDVGASRMVVGPGGLVVSPESTVVEIGAAITEAVDRSADLGEKARDHALQSFTWGRVLPRWLDLLDDVVRRA